MGDDQLRCAEIPDPPVATVPVTRDPAVAIERLLSGGLAVIPTETVYGLAARADDAAAVARIFSVKNRPTDHPLIVHIADPEALGQWTRHVSTEAATLAQRFWPGPLTLLLERAPHVSDLITAGRPTVAVRVPDHGLARRVIEHAGALVAPSANRFGRVSPTTVAHVLEDLGPYLDPDRDVILDGAQCSVGLESTIVDCTVTPPQILRPGGIASEDIATCLDRTLAPTSGPSRASGMLASHYAPRARVVTVGDPNEAVTACEGFSAQHLGCEIIDITDDTARYARDLYGLLHDADSRGVDVVIAVLPDSAGLGLAIRDRLAKAAAGRTEADVTDPTTRGR